jgi:hypothetical protein
MSSSNFSSLLSPYRESRRIPTGLILAELPLEAAKAYPIKVFDGLDMIPRIAYADRNSHGENIVLGVKLLPNGGKTAPHPQIVFYVNGSYHVENLGYYKSDPFNWKTWMEIHLDTREVKPLIEALARSAEKP